jgi:2-dehydro-3-deoxyphosphogluconate aldolase / (4S)-4-hydroxy-2-oxoglutarate aldolase
MNKVVEELGKIGIVPVIALDDAKDAEPLAKALIEGGLPCAEVTFRTEAAEESIKIMSEKYPELIVGAGTVLTPEQADRAMAAGSKFIVSPGLNPKVVKHCLDKGYPIVPGTSNPSDVETAIELGLDTVKFFPAEAAGGLKMIKSMAAPYTKMHFMPTGGINADNLKSYLDFNKIVCCGGSWMVKKDMVTAGDFEGIKNLTKQAVDTMLGFEVRHVGVNLASADEADELADTLNDMFSFEKKVGNSSIFSGTGFELMKKPGRGTNGHIAIATNYIERAIYHLEKRGFEFDKESTVIKEGRIKAIYFKGEFGGFAIHLVQK